MAFDRPLEADKVDDLGLFSSFIRAPVVGVIMWALGGDEARKIEEQEQERELKEQLSGEQYTVVNDRPVPASQLKQMIEHNRNKKNGVKLLPKLINSDLSDFNDLAINDDPDDHEEETGSMKGKKMSWSDENGQELCDFIDETSKSHQPQHATAITLPRVQAIKSAIKIPRSSRRPNGALSQSNNDASLRYIPRGLSSGHGGIVYPSNPNNGQAGNGYVSPEGWGWYITMTPPTPDLYHSNKLPQTKKNSTHGSLGLDRPGTLTNPAFKTGSQKTAMGWPSVPL